MDARRNSINQGTVTNRGTATDGDLSDRVTAEEWAEAETYTADGTGVERTTVRTDTRAVSPEPTLGQLFSDLSSDFSRLARQEIHLARAETMQSVKRASSGAITIAAGGAVAYAGVLVLLGAATIGLGALLDNYGLAALIIGVIVLIIGGILIGSGQAALKRTNFMPERTMQTLEDDAKMVKEKVTRG